MNRYFWLGLWSAVVYGIIVATLLYAQSPPTKTRVEELLEQNARILQQSAQMAAALASCEANGPQSAQFQKQAQDAITELQKSLKERGLQLKSDGTIEEIPKSEKK